MVSIVLIILLTYINTRGVKSGKIIQNTFTITKLVSLFGLIIFGFIMLERRCMARQLDQCLAHAST